MKAAIGRSQQLKLAHTNTHCLHKIDHSCKAEYSAQDMSAHTSHHSTVPSSLQLGNALMSTMFALVQRLYSGRVDSSLLKAALGRLVTVLEHDVESSGCSLLPLDLCNREELHFIFVMVPRTMEICG